MITTWLYGLGGVLAGGLLAAAFFFLYSHRETRRPMMEEKSGVIETRLELVQQFNRRLVEARDEHQLLNSLLGLLVTSTRTAGGTYIPLDELGEPLAQIHHGTVPDNPRQAWMAHLKSKEVPEVCRACKNLHKTAHAACPLAGNPFVPDGEITCIALERSGRRLGIINLYHNPGQSIGAGETAFIQELIDQASLAVENLRLHNQEVATLQQLQMVRRSSDENSEFLTRLLDSLREAASCDLAVLSFSNATPGRSRIVSGDWQEKPGFLELAARLHNEPVIVNLLGSEASRFMPGFSAVFALPLITSAGGTAGSLVAARVSQAPFSGHEQHLLDTIAAQAAMVVDNERKILDLEYRAVMDERSRLAREIHDGLAQTLAFLKLQGAQMKGFLQRGEMEELEEMIQTNQKVLSDAYAETRQAINHLRLSPQPGVRSWVNDAVRDFSQASGIEVSTSFLENPEQVPVEIQSHLIRIIQEALNNIRKHARASQVWITFRGYQGDLVLEIHDDGRGFLAEDVPSFTQYGLRGMRERAEMIGAEFQIISQPGEGTTIRLQLPYAYSQEASL